MLFIFNIVNNYTFYYVFLLCFLTFHYQCEDSSQLGAEKYAKEFDWSVVYCEIIREKRGHFTTRYHELTENPREEKEGAIIEKYVKLLEKTIESNPPFWLWSHKRWKKTKEQVFQEVEIN